MKNKYSDKKKKRDKNLTSSLGEAWKQVGVGGSEVESDEDGLAFRFKGETTFGCTEAGGEAWQEIITLVRFWEVGS